MKNIKRNKLRKDIIIGTRQRDDHILENTACQNKS